MGEVSISDTDDQLEAPEVSEEHAASLVMRQFDPPVYDNVVDMCALNSQESMVDDESTFIPDYDEDYESDDMILHCLTFKREYTKTGALVKSSEMVESPNLNDELDSLFDDQHLPADFIMDLSACSINSDEDCIIYPLGDQTDSEEEACMDMATAQQQSDDENKATGYGSSSTARATLAASEPITALATTEVVPIAAEILAASTVTETLAMLPGTPTRETLMGAKTRTTVNEPRATGTQAPERPILIEVPARTPVTEAPKRAKLPDAPKRAIVTEAPAIPTLTEGQSRASLTDPSAGPALTESPDCLECSSPTKSTILEAISGASSAALSSPDALPLDHMEISLVLLKLMLAKIAGSLALDNDYSVTSSAAARTSGSASTQIVTADFQEISSLGDHCQSLPSGLGTRIKQSPISEKGAMSAAHGNYSMSSSVVQPMSSQPNHADTSGEKYTKQHSEVDVNLPGVMTLDEFACTKYWCPRTFSSQQDQDRHILLHTALKSSFRHLHGRRHRHTRDPTKSHKIEDTIGAHL